MTLVQWLDNNIILIIGIDCQYTVKIWNALGTRAHLLDNIHCASIHCVTHWVAAK